MDEKQKSNRHKLKVAFKRRMNNKATEMGQALFTEKELDDEA